MSRNYQNHPERYGNTDPYLHDFTDRCRSVPTRPEWWPDDADLGEEDSELDLI